MFVVSLLDELSSSSEPVSGEVEPDAALDHAAPLSPLRDRDLKAMFDLFHIHEIETIEQDILQNLVLRYPEPCWEDEIFELLKEYL